MRILNRIGLVAAVACVAAAGAASPAQAEFGVKPGSFTTSLDGPQATQAGAAADYTMSFDLNQKYQDDPTSVPDGTIRDLDMQLPAGLVANPTPWATCDMSRVTEVNRPERQCPRTSAVGSVAYSILFPGGPIGPFNGRLYRVPTQGNEAAAFAFSALSFFPVRFAATVDPGNGYRIRTTGINLSEGQPLMGTTLTLWGTPEDHQGPGPLFHLGSADPLYGGPLDPSVPRHRFVSVPTRCTGDPLVTDLGLRPWQTTEKSVAYSSTLPAVSGCDQLHFDPSIAVTPASTKAGQPSAYQVDLSVPQNDDPDGLSTPNLKDAVVTLPAGVAISAPQADGLASCTDAQLAISSADPETCPAASRVGTVRVDSPLVDDPLNGSIYIAEQQSGDPESGQMYRIFLTAKGPGAFIKLRGLIKADAKTGQLTASFLDNPQLPFSKFSLNFKGGDRATLVNPATCGTYTTTSSLSSWGGQTASPSSAFAIDQGCEQAGKFDAAMNAGVTNTNAGASTSFVLNVSRPDGQQDMTGLDVSLPPGLIGDVGSVPLCPDAQAAAGTCSAASQVGHTTIAAGAGTSPLYVAQPGKAPTAVYLAGPYKGAPFSLSIVVPAQAGPFDLGTVVVRAALFIDVHDAHVTVKSDPLPTIVGGVPLKMQKINVTMDRSGFMLNPTSCNSMQVTGQVRSAQGSAVDVASVFQAGNCRALPFNPQFSASSNGTLAFKRGAAFKVHMAMPAGNANIKSVALTLPKELPSRLIPTINNACVLAQYEADYTKCPEISYVGTVTAKTPILPEPLTGPAYIVAPPNDVPQLKLKLFGQGIGKGVNVDLSGDIIIDDGRGRSKATFSTVPDVPISTFDLDLPAGPHSILDAPSGDLCKGPITADLTIIGQNGKRQDTSPRIKVDDCPKIPKAKIVSVKKSKTGITVRVKPAALGDITVSSSGLTSKHVTVDRPNVTYSVALRFTKTGKRKASTKAGLRTAAKVVYKPTNAAKALTTKAKAITVKR